MLDKIIYNCEKNENSSQLQFVLKKDPISFCEILFVHIDQHLSWGGGGGEAKDKWACE
jgi:hypothetical protein